MENFIFWAPTKIYFGKGEERKIGKILKQDDVRKVLFVYGMGSIKATGLYDKIVHSLRSEGIEFIEHPGVKPNPVLSHTLEGVKKTREFKVQAILGVGGGSVIDEAKTIAVGAVTDYDLWDYFLGLREVTSALPVYDVLTLAATGTEMNGNAVITNDETKEKCYISSPVLYPKASILNPELTFTVSPKYQAYAAADALAHLIELYFSAEYCPVIQSRLIESLVKTVMETTEIIISDPTNYEARAQFMWSSTLALNGLMQVGFRGGDFHNHLLAHAIGGLYDLPHGACLSIVIPAWMKWYKDKNKTQFSRFAKEIFGLESIDEGIDMLKSWFKKINTPVSLKEAGLDESSVEEIAKMVVRLAPRWELSDVYDLNTAKEILSLCVR